MTDYKYLTTSPAGFVQQLAVSYVSHGYWFYVTGTIPKHKDPFAVDEKLMAKYGVRISKWQRARRKVQGKANVHYLRYERTFVLIATLGAHEFRQEELSEIRDIRREPLSFMGYSIGYRRGVDRRFHASVRIHPIEYQWLKAYFTELATHRDVASIRREFHLLPFEAYAPVRRQLLNILRSMNRTRKQAGLPVCPHAVLRLRRSIVKPFGPVGHVCAA